MGYRGIKATVGPAVHMLYQPWIRGEENIPTEGPAILASNHLAVIDSFFLPLMIEREVAFIGKSDYFTGKGVKGWAVKNFMRTVGTIPVDRSGGKASQAALQAGIDRLNSGELFGIYPEGTRSKTGSMLPFHPGSFKIAQKAGVPLVIASISGSEKIKRNLFLRPTNVDLSILDVVPADKVKEMSTNELADYSRGLIERSLPQPAKEAV